jgi:hypothetical protein
MQKTSVFKTRNNVRASENSSHNSVTNFEHHDSLVDEEYLDFYNRKIGEKESVIESRENNLQNEAKLFFDQVLKEFEEDLKDTQCTKQNLNLTSQKSKQLTIKPIQTQSSFSIRLKKPNLLTQKVLNRKSTKEKKSRTKEFMINNAQNNAYLKNLIEIHVKNESGVGKRKEVGEKKVDLSIGHAKDSVKNGVERTESFAKEVKEMNKSSADNHAVGKTTDETVAIERRGKDPYATDTKNIKMNSVVDDLMKDCPIGQTLFDKTMHHQSEKTEMEGKKMCEINNLKNHNRNLQQNRNQNDESHKENDGELDNGVIRNSQSHSSVVLNQRNPDNSRSEFLDFEKLRTSSPEKTEFKAIVDTKTAQKGNYCMRNTNSLLKNSIQSRTFDLELDKKVTKTDSKSSKLFVSFSPNESDTSYEGKRSNLECFEGIKTTDVANDKSHGSICGISNFQNCENRIVKMQRSCKSIELKVENASFVSSDSSDSGEEEEVVVGKETKEVEVSDTECVGESLSVSCNSVYGKETSLAFTLKRESQAVVDADCLNEDFDNRIKKTIANRQQTEELFRMTEEVS